MTKDERAAYMRDYRKRKRLASHQPAKGRPAPTPDSPEAKRLIDYMESRLVVPTGMLAGQPMQVLPWQRKFLTGLYRPEISCALLSIARKNAKTGCIAALILAHLDEQSPFNRRYWKAAVIAYSEHLAALVSASVREMAEASGIEIEHRRAPKPETIFGALGSQVEILSGEKNTGLHGRALDLAIVDEAGLLGARERELVASARSSISTTEGKFVALGTRLKGEIFNELLDGLGDDESVFSMVFESPVDAPIDSRKTWKLANPSMPHLKSEKHMRDAARQALKLGGQAARDFRSHELNMRVADSGETLCSLDDWIECERDELPPKFGPCFVGLDLGGSQSLCAGVAYWPETGRLDFRLGLPAQPDLLDRGQSDSVGDLYQKLRQSGELVLVGGRVADVAKFVPIFMSEVLGDSPVAGVGCDAYRRSELIEALADSVAGTWPWSWRGVGYAKFSKAAHDCRSFQMAVLERQVAVSKSAAWLHALSSSLVRYDQAGNPSLNKSKRMGRIDLLQAAVIAVGLARESEQLAASAPQIERIAPGQ